jgi:hypothetical protein
MKILIVILLVVIVLQEWRRWRLSRRLEIADAVIDELNLRLQKHVNAKRNVHH